MSVFFRWIPYLLASGTIAAAAIDLYRKREEYKNKRLRQGVIILFIATGILTIFGLYHDNSEKEAEKQKAEDANNTLQAKVDTANRAQKENTAIFLKQFKDVYDEVGDLKTQIKTDALQKKLDRVQAELLKTQKAMAPAPKAAIAFSFVPFENPLAPRPMVPSTNVDLPVDADGSVHVEFSFLNVTDVTALSASVTLVICDQCKFAKEIENFERASGEAATRRTIFVRQLDAGGYLATMQANIIPPPTVPEFRLGIQYRCSTCVVDKNPTFQTVRLVRDFFRPVK
jgi:hypothetical protein